ncbi:MAG: hypothetical protein GY839_14295 [candidate division Zixibacteria bacterium]|nr:hypothetical protein [candidate division Zixibacteria bacterium]
MNNHDIQIRKKIRWPATGQLITGILLIILGAIFLFSRLLGQWFISDFWPFFLVVGGLIFYAAYYARSEKPIGYEGLLFPGTYLIVLGLLFLSMNLFGWHNMRFMWPTFILGVPISLLAMYKFGPSEPDRARSDLQTAIKIIGTVSIVLFVIAGGGFFLWPLALIIIGLVIILKGYIK